MKKYNLISGFFWLGIGLGFGWGGFYYGFGSWREPGPGLLPVVFGVTLAFLSLGLLGVTAKAKKGGVSKPFWQGQGSWKPVLITILLLFAYMGFLKQAGFILTTFMVVFSLLKFVAGKRWMISLGVALVLSFFCYGLFSGLLGTPLPKGQIIYGSAPGPVARV